MTRLSERPSLSLVAPHVPRIAQVGPQVPPAPPLRCARNALRYGAGPSYGLPGQSATGVNCGRRSRAAKKVRISIAVHTCPHGVNPELWLAHFPLHALSGLLEAPSWNREQRTAESDHAL